MTPDQDPYQGVFLYSALIIPVKVRKPNKQRPVIVPAFDFQKV